MIKEIKYKRCIKQFNNLLDSLICDDGLCYIKNDGSNEYVMWENYNEHNLYIAGTLAIKLKNESTRDVFLDIIDKRFNKDNCGIVYRL